MDNPVPDWLALLREQDVEKRLQAMSILKNNPALASAANVRLLEQAFLRDPAPEVQAAALEVLQTPVYAAIGLNFTQASEAGRRFMLTEINQLEAEGLLPPASAQIIRRRYALPQPMPPVAVPSPVAPPPPFAQIQAPHPPRPQFTLSQILLGETTLKVTLYLGAFFVVAAAFILAALVEGIRLPILLGLTAASLGAGLWLRKRLPLAGFVLHGVGAVMFIIDARALPDPGDLAWALAFLASGLSLAVGAWFFTSRLFALTAFGALGTALVFMGGALYWRWDAILLTLGVYGLACLVALTHFGYMEIVKKLEHCLFWEIQLWMGFLQVASLVAWFADAIFKFVSRSMCLPIGLLWLLGSIHWLLSDAWQRRKGRIGVWWPFFILNVIGVPWMIGNTWDMDVNTWCWINWLWGAALCTTAEAVRKFTPRWGGYSPVLIGASVLPFLYPSLSMINQQSTLPAILFMVATGLVYAGLTLRKSDRWFTGILALLYGYGAYIWLYRLLGENQIQVNASLFMLMPVLVLFAANLWARKTQQGAGWRLATLWVGLLAAYVHLMMTMGFLSAADRAGAALGFVIYGLYWAIYAILDRRVLLHYLATASIAIGVAMAMWALEQPFVLSFAILAWLYYLTGTFFRENGLNWLRPRPAPRLYGNTMVLPSPSGRGQGKGSFIPSPPGRGQGEGSSPVPDPSLDRKKNPSPYPLPGGEGIQNTLRALTAFLKGGQGGILTPFGKGGQGGILNWDPTLAADFASWQYSALLLPLFAFIGMHLRWDGSPTRFAEIFPMLEAAWIPLAVTLLCGALYAVYAWREPKRWGVWLNYAAALLFAWALGYALYLLRLENYALPYVLLAAGYYAIGVRWSKLAIWQGIALLTALLGLLCVYLAVPGYPQTFDGYFPVLVHFLPPLLTAPGVAILFILHAVRFPEKWGWLHDIAAVALAFGFSYGLYLLHVTQYALPLAFLALVYYGAGLFLQKGRPLDQPGRYWQLAGVALAGLVFATTLFNQSHLSALAVSLCASLFAIHASYRAPNVSWLTYLAALGYAWVVWMEVGLWGSDYPALPLAFLAAAFYGSAQLAPKISVLRTGRQWRNSAFALGAVCALLALLETGPYGILAAAIGATLYALEAFRRRSVWWGYPTNTLYFIAYCIALRELRVSEPQYYTIGAALLGIIMHYLVVRSAENDRHRWIAFATGVLAQLVLLSTTYIQMVVYVDLKFFLILFFQGLVLLAYGLVVRSRSFVLTSTGFLVLGVLTVAFRILSGLSTALIIGITGLALVALAIAGLSFRARIASVAGQIADRLNNW